MTITVHPQYHKGECAAPMTRWRVRQRRSHNSAFAGYRETPSSYSGLVCLRCGATWRTKAAYVDQVADVAKGEWP